MENITTSPQVRQEICSLLSEGIEEEENILTDWEERGSAPYRKKWDLTGILISVNSYN